MNVSSVHLLITHRRIEKDSPKVFPMRATEFYIGVLKKWFKIVGRMNNISPCYLFSYILQNGHNSQKMQFIRGWKTFKKITLESL